MPAKADKSTGVVIAVHGTRIKESSSVYDDVARLVSKKTGANVLTGYMKHGTPTIREAVEKLVNDGTEEVIVVPLFFVRGLHVSEDIPSLLSDINAKITLAEPIGADERLADIIAERVKDGHRKKEL